jgi:sugar phosphate isomerase/epimerase
MWTHCSQTPLHKKEGLKMINKKQSISRREFIKNSVIGATVLASASRGKLSAAPAKTAPLRLGGPIFKKYDGPDTWVQILQRLGYRAAYCPIGIEEKDEVVKAYAKAAQEADIIIAEVGAWSNPISPNAEMRKQALEKCREHLALADRIGASCCVNISGSRNEKHWAGPHADNLTQETFGLIVETTRAIIDDVKPTRTYFTLEAMPWSYPDSPDSYVRLIKAIDRERFAVHLDPVNFVVSPQVYFNSGKMIRECFEKLGPKIRSCHGKDIILNEEIYTPHLDELRPGLGRLDYATLLKELSKFPDTPLMLEHLPDAEQYRLAAEHIRSVARTVGLSFD